MISQATFRLVRKVAKTEGYDDDTVAEVRNGRDFDICDCSTICREMSVKKVKNKLYGASPQGKIARKNKQNFEVIKIREELIEAIMKDQRKEARR